MTNCIAFRWLITRFEVSYDIGNERDKKSGLFLDPASIPAIGQTVIQLKPWIVHVRNITLWFIYIHWYKLKFLVPSSEWVTAMNRETKARELMECNDWWYRAVRVSVTRYHVMAWAIEFFPLRVFPPFCMTVILPSTNSLIIA